MIVAAKSFSLLKAFKTEAEKRGYDFEGSKEFNVENWLEDTAYERSLVFHPKARTFSFSNIYTPTHHLPGDWHKAISELNPFTTVILNAFYTAIVTDDKVIINGQEISFEAIGQIFKEVCKRQTRLK